MHVISCTSGNELPATVVRESRVRRLLLLPWLRVAYVGTNLKGPCIYTGWRRPSAVKGFVA